MQRRESDVRSALLMTVHKSILAATMLVLTALAGCPAIGQTGPAHVVDGDTIDVAGTRIRLWGIDAPESRQVCARGDVTYACGLEATAHLRSLIGDVSVSCERRTTDRYGRIVAICHARMIDIGAAMVSDGWAMAFRRYSTDYAGEEREARAARRGMWAGTFTPPWDWRAARGHPLSRALPAMRP
jgi:endonuclease YncB( thermonuclease family)